MKGNAFLPMTFPSVGLVVPPDPNTTSGRVLRLLEGRSDPAAVALSAWSAQDFTKRTPQ
jgi:hypothetical protein